MKKKLTCLEISATSNKKSAEKLNFEGDENAQIMRPSMCLQTMTCKYNPDLVAVRDISKKALDELEKMMGIAGYKMYIHPDWLDITSGNKGRYSCLQCLFVKKNNSLVFKQISGDEDYETTLRSVTGTIKFMGYKIYYRTEHIPMVDEELGKGWLEEQKDRKKKQLQAAISFQEKHDNDLAINAGDFNGNGKKGVSCYCKALYKNMCFTDLVSENTFGNTQIDSVFISKGLKESKINVSVNVLNDFYLQYTDHKIMMITIEMPDESGIC